MKKYLFAGLSLVFCLTVAFGCSKQEETSALNINDIGPDPAAYVGQITITGITAGFSPQDASVFGVMDRKELQCQSANCNKLIIPIRFQGQQPAIGDEVLATGSFVKTARGFLFVAEGVKILRNHKLGVQGS